MRSTTRLLMTIVLVCGIGAVRAQDFDTKAGQSSAEAWLALVDDGAYAESWKTAANLFKKAVTEEQWQGMLKTVRDPLGKLKERSLKAATPTKTPPGAPAGEYIVFDFSTTFANKAAAGERVTVMKDTDGMWRVGGYFVK